MITHAKASQYVDKKHIYAGVTAMEAINCPHDKQVTEVDGTTLLATDVPYKAIEAKELVA